MVLSDVVEFLSKLEKKLAARGVHDNTEFDSSHLKIWADGSWSLEVDWKTNKNDEEPIGVPDAKRLLRGVFTTRDEYLCGDSIGSLMTTVLEYES